MKTNRRQLLNTINHYSLSGNKINFVKCWKGTSYEHWRTLSDIAWKLINQGYDIMTEVDFKTTGRADLVAINLCGDGYIIEVLHTENEREFDNKVSKYPSIFHIVKVKTSNFNINTWEL